MLIWFISLLLSFILYWIFSDIVLWITAVLVGLTIFILKGIRKQRFIVLEVILLAVYIILLLGCILFPSASSLKILVIILGIWFLIYIYAYKLLS